jgi:hypothetical protein
LSLHSGLTSRIPNHLSLNNRVEIQKKKRKLYLSMITAAP